MSALGNGDLLRRLDDYRQMASDIETRLAEARDRLAGPVADAVAFLIDVDRCLTEIESDAEYGDALVRCGARAVLDRLEDLRLTLSVN